MRFIWAFFLAFGLAPLPAQTPAYMHYTVADGLPGNFVHCGLQDRRGLLWFGTDKGLACFDGNRFRTYGVADGLPDPEVLNMKEDSQGRIWLSCFRKKPCYLLNGRIITEKQDSMLEKINLATGTYVISEEPGGGIWFSEASPRTFFVQQNNIRSFKFPDAVASLPYVDGTQLILGLSNIMRFTADGELKVLHEVENNGHPSIALSGKRILYGYTNGLLLMEWNNGYIRDLAKQTRPAGQVFTDHLGRFWLCSPAVGAVMFDNYSADLSNPVPFLAGKKVNKGFEDREHNLWFCTVNEGVYGLQQNAPLIYQQPDKFPSLNIRSLARNASGQLFVGDDVGNIHLLKGDRIQTVTIGSKDGYNLVRQLIAGGGDTLWIASDEGLYCCSDQYRKLLVMPHRLSLKSIWLQDEVVWNASATTLGYLAHNAPDINIIIGRRFTTVCADAVGNIWAGGIDGLYSRRDSFAFNWGDRFPELKNRIIALHPHGNDQLWVVTPKDELLLADVQAGQISRVQVVNDSLNSPIKNIQSLYVEPGGRLWLATNRGIYGVDDHWQVVHYDTHDGLADDDVNAVLVHQDTLWAATVSGLTRMLLRRPEEHGDFQSLVVAMRYQKDNETTEIYLLDSVQSAQHREIVLSADASMLEIDMAGLDFRSRGNLRFEVIQTKLRLPLRWWTLDNLLSTIFVGIKSASDTTIIESGTFNLGVHVPPGRYQITVRAIKSSGVASDYPDTRLLMILPDWYQTIWFYLVLWGIAVLVIWRMYRARLEFREMNAAAAILQLQALQAQMNPHFIGNTVNAIQQFLHPPDPEKTSEYITIFMRLLRRTMHYSEETFISFEEEMAYDREYLQLVHLRFENKFRYEIQGADHIPPETLIPSMMLQPALENATIHGIAPEGTSVLCLQFSLENGRLQCVLTDNGIGINASRARKHLFSRERESKGVEMLHKKIQTLNRLYNLDLTLEIQDLSEQDATRTGTRIVITYFPDKIWKVKTKQQAHVPV